MNVPFDARITAVTVHPDCARVTRKGGAPVPAGESTLVLPGLSAATRPDSVRAAVFGDGVRVGDVDVVAAYDTRTLPTDLQATLDQLRDEDATLADGLDAVERRLAALATVEETGSRSAARALVGGRAGAEAIDALLAATTERVAAAHAERRELQRRRRDVLDRLHAAEAERDRLAGEGPVLRREVRVRLSAEAATEVEVELSSIVDGATWEPAYDARVDSASGGGQVELTVHALVRQWTTEDWEAVELTLATTRPGRSTVIPELGPWLVDEDRPVVMAVAAAAAPMPAAAPAGAPVQPTRQARAAVDAAHVEQVGTAATFHAARPVDVPSDGSPHKVVLTVVDLGAELDHVTVPKVVEEAYLRATVTNTSGTTLLTGPVRVYHGEQFAGSTTLDTMAPGAETELQLGVDDRIEVERKLVRRGSGRGLLGPGKTAIGYETTVTNHLDVAARVDVIDNIPVAGRDDIRVKIDTLKPEPAERDDRGVCTWRVDLAPGASATIAIGATIEHPRGMRLRGI